MSMLSDAVCKLESWSQPQGIKCASTIRSAMEVDKKLKALRGRCQEVRVQNRKIIETDTKPRVYGINDEDLEHSAAQEGISDGYYSDVYSKRVKRLLQTTLREFERSSSKKESRDHNDGSNNTNHGDQLATATYNKELKALSDIKAAGTSKMNALVKNLNDTSKKRYQIRKKQMEKNKSLNEKTDSSLSGYVNEKNKQFNEKLQRELQKEE